MPTYEYVCRSCGTPLEVVQAFSDPALTVCPTCGGVLRKIFGNVGISFKGSGFYKTDNRTDRKSSTSSSSSDGSASTPAASTTSSESTSTPSDSSSSSSSTDSKPAETKTAAPSTPSTSS